MLHIHMILLRQFILRSYCCIATIVIKQDLVEDFGVGSNLLILFRFNFKSNTANSPYVRHK